MRHTSSQAESLCKPKDLHKFESLFSSITMILHTQTYLSIILTITLTGCAVYESRPIDLKTEEQAWRLTTPTQGKIKISQAEAIKTGLILNPELNKARIKLANTEEVEKQSGWWADPSISWEMAKVLQENILNHSGGISLSIPLTGIPALEKKLAEQYKESDYWSLKQAELDFCTELETNWHALSITKAKKELVQERLKSLKNETQIINKLIKVGEAEFAIGQTATERLNTITRELQELEETEQIQTLALLKQMGMHPDGAKHIQIISQINYNIPRLIKAPSAGKLMQLPKIKAQMATYATTETALKAEIRRQYPDLEIGPGFSREDDEKEVGGEFGFNIPLWNRNRQAIAEARGNRNLAHAETIQLWKETLFHVKELETSQNIISSHCKSELSRLNDYTRNLITMEKLYKHGEIPMPELSESRHLKYESQVNFLTALEKLLQVRTQIIYLAK